MNQNTILITAESRGYRGIFFISMQFVKKIKNLFHRVTQRRAQRHTEWKINSWCFLWLKQNPWKLKLICIINIFIFYRWDADRNQLNIFPLWNFVLLWVALWYSLINENHNQSACYFNNPRVAKAQRKTLFHSSRSNVSP